MRTYRAVGGANHVGDTDVRALLASGRCARTDAGIWEVCRPQKMRTHDEQVVYTLAGGLASSTQLQNLLLSIDGILT